MTTGSASSVDRDPTGCWTAERIFAEGERAMDYSLLGPTGVKVSKVCLGTATFGVAPDAE